MYGEKFVHAVLAYTVKIIIKKGCKNNPFGNLKF